MITDISFLLCFFFYLAWILYTLHSTARYNNCRESKHMFNKITVSPWFNFTKLIAHPNIQKYIFLWFSICNFFIYFKLVMEINLTIQIQMPRSLLSHRRHSWQQTDSSVKYATKGSKEIKTFNYIEEDTTFHGSLDRDPTKMLSRRKFTSVQRRPVSTMTLQEHLVTSQV